MTQIIRENEFTIPVIWIKGNMYLVGSERLVCDQKADSLTVRTGGGYQEFSQYVQIHENYHQKVLINHMINNDESLEWVTEQLKEGKKMKAPIKALSNIRLVKPKSGL